jgi:hypothetical protein
MTESLTPRVCVHFHSNSLGKDSFQARMGCGGRIRISIRNRPERYPGVELSFLANDFGTLRTYQKLHSKGYENPPTWRHLKDRIRRARLPEDRIFCTNAILGLRTGDKVTALDRSVWPRASMFAAFCHEFLIYQVEVLRPRLVVILGPVAQSSLEAMGAILKERTSLSLKATIGRHTTAIHYSSHPYGDFNFTDQRKSTDAFALRNAWDEASRPSVNRR